MDDLKGKEDGINLILEPGYSFEDLSKYIKSNANGNLHTLGSAENVQEICKEILELLNSDDLTLDEVTTLFVIVSMIYFIEANTENIELRTHLLHKTFRYVDTMHPIHLHVATKRMWNGLKLEGIKFVFNMLKICHQIAVASDTGRAIATSLIWVILCTITETEIEMYCFHEFSELIKMLKNINDETLQMEDSTTIVYILVQVIGFLINVIVFGQNDDFKKAGYRNYFTYKRRDLEKLVNWSEHLCETLKVSVSKTNNYWDLRMAINEYVSSNITGILQDKISDLTDMQKSAKY